MSARRSRRVVTPRQVFRELFRSKKLDALPFLPYTYELAARVEQVALTDMWRDPSLMVNALVHTQQIMGHDVLLIRMDQNLSPALNGAGPGAGEVSLEVARRLKKTLGNRVALACQVTGPLTMARSLLGEDPLAGLNGNGEQAVMEEILQSVLRMIRAVGETQPDLILVAEEEVGAGVATEAEAAMVSGFLKPLWNNIRYYESEPLLVTNNVGRAALDLLSNDVSGVILSNDAGYGLGELARLFESRGVCFGLPLPGEVLAGCRKTLSGFLREVKSLFGGQGAFVCSGGEIPADIPLEYLKEVIEEFKKI